MCIPEPGRRLAPAALLILILPFVALALPDRNPGSRQVTGCARHALFPEDSCPCRIEPFASLIEWLDPEEPTTALFLIPRSPPE